MKNKKNVFLSEFFIKSIKLKVLKTKVLEFDNKNVFLVFRLRIITTYLIILFYHNIFKSLHNP